VACRSHELGSSPRPVLLAGIPCVLFRDAEERARALLDRCPHRGVPLSAGCVTDGALTCPYHGYRFDGDGHCVLLPGLNPEARIPKALNTPSLHVVEQDGFVWVERTRWGSEDTPPRLPFVSHPDYHTTVWSLTTRGALVDGLENFLDATHTHFVHAGLIRRARARRKVHVEVRREGAVAEARYIEHAAGTGDSQGLISRLLARDIDGRFGRFVAPCIAQLEYRRGHETAMVISALFTPVGEGELSVWAVVTTKHVPYLPSSLVRALVKPLFAMAIRQDRHILGLQEQGRRAFPTGRPVISPTDVLRPHIEHMMQNGPSPRVTKNLTLEL
jgi:phenylpropionate dioxygenase-like ring-hydroxylating dioxygenase large terminal subunit